MRGGRGSGRGHPRADRVLCLRYGSGDAVKAVVAVSSLRVRASASVLQVQCFKMNVEAAAQTGGCLDSRRNRRPASIGDATERLLRQTASLPGVEPRDLPVQVTLLLQIGRLPGSGLVGVPCSRDVTGHFKKVSAHRMEAAVGVDPRVGLQLS